LTNAIKWGKLSPKIQNINSGLALVYEQMMYCVGDIAKMGQTSEGAYR